PAPTPAEIGISQDPEEAIVEVLAQLTACWATGDPALVLALFSEGFLSDATGDGAVSLDELANDIRQQQTTPIVWELAGEVEVDDDEATAIVAATFDDQELLQTFLFELGDDGWRLGNFGE
ncbi:MAG: nuclear transport factor 2 family protein, partial [Thermomicrobiales bacterium]